MVKAMKKSYICANPECTYKKLVKDKGYCPECGDPLKVAPFEVTLHGGVIEEKHGVKLRKWRVINANTKHGLYVQIAKYENLGYELLPESFSVTIGGGAGVAVSGVGVGNVIFYYSALMKLKSELSSKPS